MANPLKQFEIVPLIDLSIPLEIGRVDISFTNSALMMLIGALLSTITLTIAMRHKKLVPGRMQVMAEMLYEFIAGMIRENIGPEGRQYFPLIFTLFIVVLMGNLLGMLPYSFTYTSHIIVTMALALMIFFVVIFVGLIRNGLEFLTLFMPSGVPMWLAPLLIPLEIISFLARPLTLGVRLFANMMAGHIMLKVFAGFCVMLVNAGVIGIAFGILPMVVNSLVIAFEVMIALIHAYIFAILSCIYLKDTVDLHH